MSALSALSKKLSVASEHADIVRRATSGDALPRLSRVGRGALQRTLVQHEMDEDFHDPRAKALEGPTLARATVLLLEVYDDLHGNVVEEPLPAAAAAAAAAARAAATAAGPTTLYAGMSVADIRGKPAKVQAQSLLASLREKFATLRVSHKEVLESKNFVLQDFWRAVIMSEAKFKSVVDLFKFVVAQPASEADCERAFSMASRIRTKDRNRMTPQCLDQLTVIHAHVCGLSHAEQLEFVKAVARRLSNRRDGRRRFEDADEESVY